MSHPTFDYLNQDLTDTTSQAQAPSTLPAQPKEVASPIKSPSFDYLNDTSASLDPLLPAPPQPVTTEGLWSSLGRAARILKNVAFLSSGVNPATGENFTPEEEDKQEQLFEQGGATAIQAAKNITNTVGKAATLLEYLNAHSNADREALKKENPEAFESAANAGKALKEGLAHGRLNPLGGNFHPFSALSGGVGMLLTMPVDIAGQAVTATTGLDVSKSGAPIAAPEDRLKDAQSTMTMIGLGVYGKAAGLLGEGVEVASVPSGGLIRQAATRFISGGLHGAEGGFVFGTLSNAGSNQDFAAGVSTAIQFAPLGSILKAMPWTGGTYIVRGDPKLAAEYAGHIAQLRQLQSDLNSTVGQVTANSQALLSADNVLDAVMNGTVKLAPDATHIIKGVTKLQDVAQEAGGIKSYARSNGDGTFDVLFPGNKSVDVGLWKDTGFLPEQEVSWGGKDYTVVGKGVQTEEGTQLINLRAADGQELSVPIENVRAKPVDLFETSPFQKEALQEPQTGVPYTGVAYRAVGEGKNPLEAGFNESIFMTPDPKFAMNFGGDSGIIHQIRFSFENPKVLVTPDIADLNTNGSQQIIRARQEGHDALIVKDPDGHTEIIALNPEKVEAANAAPIEGEGTKLETIEGNVRLEDLSNAQLNAADMFLRNRLRDETNPKTRAALERDIQKIHDVRISENTPSPVSMLKTGEGTVGAGFDRSLLTKLGANLYKNNLGIVAIKEGLQNAIDAVRGKSDGLVDIHIDEKNNEVTFDDNGHGMTPDVAQNEFMDVGGSFKLEGSSGGYGLAKVGLLSNAKHFELTTVAKDADGNYIETHISGSGEDWANGTLKFETEPARTHDTGTNLTIKFNNDTIKDWYDAHRFLSTAIGHNQTGIKITGSSGLYGEIFPTGPEGNSIRTNLSAKGADIEALVSEDKNLGAYSHVHVLNNGLYQFTYTHYGEGDTPLPREVVFNVKPTVGVENSKYPFTTAREELKGDAAAQIEKFFREINQNANKAHVLQLINSLNNAPPIKNSEGRIYYSEAVPPELAAKIANSDYAARLNEAWSKISQLIRNRGNTRFTEIPEFEFGGISLNPEALGTNISRKILLKLAQKNNIEFTSRDSNLIVINPFTTLSDILARSVNRGTLNGELPISDWVDRLTFENWATLVHEVAHQLARGHTEQFAGAQTRLNAATADLYPTVEPLLRKAWIDILQGGTQSQFVQHFDSYRDAINAEFNDPLKQLSGHQSANGDLSGNVESRNPHWNDILRTTERSEIRGNAQSSSSSSGDLSGREGSTRTVSQDNPTDVQGAQSGQNGNGKLSVTGTIHKSLITNGDIDFYNNEIVPILRRGRSFKEALTILGDNPPQLFVQALHAIHDNFGAKYDPASLVRQMGSNGFTLDPQEGTYVVRDAQTNDVIGRFGSPEAASNFAQKSGQARGIELSDGGNSNVPPIDGGGAMAQDGPPPKNWAAPYTPIEPTRLQNILAHAATALPWLEPKRAFMTAVDKLNGTKLFEKVYQPLQVALGKKYAELSGSLLELKNIAQNLSGISVARRSLIGQVRESMSPEDVINSFMHRPMNPNEILEAQRFAAKNGGEPIDVEKVMAYRRARQQLTASYDRILGNVEKEAPNAGLAEARKQALAQREQELRDLIDIHGIKDHELQAANRLDEIQKKFSPDDMSIGAIVRLTRSYINDELSRDEAAVRAGLTKDEMQIIIDLDKFYNKYADVFGIEDWRRLGQYMNHYRRYQLEPEIFNRRTLDGRQTVEQFVSNMIRTGEVTDFIDDPIDAAMAYLRQGYNAKYMNVTMNRARLVAVGEIRKLKNTSQENVAKVVKEYLDDARGIPAASTTAMEDAFDGMMTQLGIKDHWKPRLRRDVINGLTAWTSSALLGFKPELGIRDFGSWFTLHYSRFGFDRAMNAMKMAFETDENGVRRSDQLIAKGIIPQLGPVDIFTAQELEALQGRSKDANLVISALSKFEKGAEKVNNLGMAVSLQRNMYARIHAGAYLEAQRLAAGTLLDLARNKIDKATAYDKLDLDSYDSPVAQAFDNLVTQGKFEEAADFLGRATAVETAFIHGLANHPYGWGSNVGRLAGQFGTWSMWARNYMVRLATVGEPRKRAARVSRFIASQAAVVGMGRVLGFNTTSWQVLPGLLWAGGPMVQAIMNTPSLAGVRGTQEQKAAIGSILNHTKSFQTMFVPGSYAFHDFMSALMLDKKNYNIVAQFGKGMGFSIDQTQRSFLDEWLGNYPQVTKQTSTLDYLAKKFSLTQNYR